MAGPLSEALPKKLGRVLTGLSLETGPSAPVPPDGVVEVALGVGQIDLAIPRQVARSYPVSVAIGLDLTYRAEDGTVLFSKKLQSVGRGEVQVTQQTCDVTGLEPVVREAVDLASEGLAKHVAESVKLREYAERRPSMPAGPAAPTEGAAAPAASAAPVPVPVPVPPASASVATAAEQEAATALSFRAIIRDENRDQIIQQGESLTIEVEVKNEGAVGAKGVEVDVSGTAALVGQLPPVLSFGDLAAGELKRVTSTAQASAINEPVQAELTLALRSTTPVAALPPPKKFTMAMKPERASVDDAAPDVDLPPKSAGLKQPKALIVSIGVGRYRDGDVPSVKYAGRDAEIMAGYLRAISGVSEDRTRVLIDNYALKDDVAETFEEWLPKRVDPATVVYVFFSGRAVVDGVTGAVSLVPFDGSTGAVHRLYSVRRLQESLVRASVRRAILMFDVSLEPSPGVTPEASARPVWDSTNGERKDQIMWMVAHKGLQEAHAYEPGRHGLFTYHLLRGLQGLADVDHDGTVVAGELCTYARNHTNRVAREQFGNEQDPICLPPTGQGAMVRIHPMAKGNNPKPAVTKKEEPSSRASTSAPAGVGPGPTP